ncbi:TPA: hypothetical protein N0F65_012082 [Lagenidium giganteum]|uniref:Vacuolar membrane-associated protein iml1 n=1 Tax=Lagenidium giganteum TaxID=4803 RepID=A0AAV2YLX9_9STRA|nr:TPA: hypothetical protein N0F65_012082 [Lagenidium giganteum]
MRRRYERKRLAAQAQRTAQAAANAQASGALAAAATGGAGGASTSASSAAAARKRNSIQTGFTQFKLHVHGHEFHQGEELVLNPECFPELQDMPLHEYVVELFHPRGDGDASSVMMMAGATASAAAPRHHLLLEVRQNSMLPVKGKMQVSVLKDTAACFQLSPFKDVNVRFISKALVEVDFVEISLKDQFLSRRDLWYLKKSLVGTALYVGKNVRVQGTRWQVLELRAGTDKVRSGVISERTRFAFRSRTSRVMWLIQLSPEMWEIANNGKLYLEILLNVVHHVLGKWIQHKVSHSLTIIFFSRSYFPEFDDKTKGAAATQRDQRRKTRGASTAAPPSGTTFPFRDNSRFSVGVDEEGRYYQDYYKIVAFDSQVTDAEPLLVTLKRELNEFPHACRWRAPWQAVVRTSTDSDLEGEPSSPALSGIPSNARDGNLLEAINIVLNIFEKHHIDRHLARSGQNLVLFTAGNGIFSVNKRLSEITEQRMMDHGIGIDMISLSTPPLHKCPLFLFKQSGSRGVLKLNTTLGVGVAAPDTCMCGSSGMNKTTTQRRSRTASTDGISDAYASTSDVHATSMRAMPLCKHCLQRQENCKHYVVPLWIPLSFVEDEMMADHSCPLDDDITAYCPVCYPIHLKTKGFEPLPLCQMFRGNPGLGSNPARDTLPRPLECLLNRFEPVPKMLCDADDDDSITDEDITSLTITSQVSNSSDFLFCGRESDLVRARTSSITTLDDSHVFGGSNLPKVRSFSPSEPNKVLQEFEKYDDQVFAFSSGRSRQVVKPSDGGDSSGRLCSTPPLKYSTTTIGPNSTTKHRLHPGSAGNATSEHAGRQWMERSPSRVKSDSGSIGSDHREASSTGGTPNTRGGHTDGKSRNMVGSLPCNYALDLATSGLPHITSSPILVPADGPGKDDLFHTHGSIYKHLTSKQRRWSQLYPAEEHYKLVQRTLKWKSALLPLTSDYLPSPKELQAHYTESFYSVTLPERDEHSGATFRDYRELVMEMIAQRFSQDFQLITQEESNATTTPCEKESTVYRMSMGHRIHEIMFNEETQTIDVKRYLQRATTKSDVDIMDYRYCLWSPVASAFVKATQEFRKYPRSEYGWNYLDQLICGYLDDMHEGIRYKRIMYCVLPPVLDGSENDQVTLQEYTERFRKFIEFVRSKGDSSGGFPSVNFNAEWRESMPTSGVDSFKRVEHDSVKIPLHAPDAPTNQNWVMLKCDTELLGTQCFHIEVQWLVCRSSLVEDFTTGLLRRAKQLGLEILQVPENGISSNLDMHPLICPVFIPVREPSVQRQIEAALVDRFGFAAEGLHPIPLAHTNHRAEYEVIQHTDTSGRRRRVAFYRQYIHRQLSCYVRLTQTGLVWVSNRKLTCQSIQTIFDGIAQMVASVQLAHSALETIVDRVMLLAATTTLAAAPIIEKIMGTPDREPPRPSAPRLSGLPPAHHHHHRQEPLAELLAKPF